jgi:hypothetical protein
MEFSVIFIEFIGRTTRSLQARGEVTVKNGGIPIIFRRNENCGNYWLGLQVLMRFQTSSLLDNFTEIRFPSSVVRHQNPYYEKSLLKGVAVLRLRNYISPSVCKGPVYLYRRYPGNSH